MRILAEAGELPPFARARVLSDTPLDGVHTIVTFEPFARLPAPVQRAYLARRLRLVPSPASLIVFEHPLYRHLSIALSHAMQIPLLHLFPRCEERYKLRIPQSGWLDEQGTAHHTHGHRIVSHVTRTHRWQRVTRDEALPTDGGFADKVSVALFSTNPDDLGLYGKPMAKNAQIWTHDYALLLDGPHAAREDLERAARALKEGGRFGYRFLYPAMRAGERELFWHLPLVARWNPESNRSALFSPRLAQAPLGYVSAEAASGDAPPIELSPRLLARDGHEEAATIFAHERGHLRLTTSFNARKLLEARALLGEPLAPSPARALLRSRRTRAWRVARAARRIVVRRRARRSPRVRAAQGAGRGYGPRRAGHLLGNAHPRLRGAPVGTRLPSSRSVSSVRRRTPTGSP